MPNKILFLSFRWNDERLWMHSSDKIMANGFKKLGWGIYYHDYRDTTKELGEAGNQSAMYNKIMEVQPDILFINKGEKIDPNIITKARKNGFKGWVCGWYADQRKTPVKCVVAISKVCDHFFHCKTGETIENYNKLTKCPSSFLFAPYEPDYMRRKPLEDREDTLTWFGQIYDKRKGWESHRQDIIPSIKHLLDNWGACLGKSFIRGKDYYDALCNSKISINIPAIDQYWYFSNRLSHIMGSGCVPITYRFKGYDEMFEEGINCISFKDSMELLEKYNYYSENPSALNNIAKNSLDFAKTNMESTKVAQDIIKVYED